MEEVTSITPAANIEASKEVSTIATPTTMKKAKAKVTMSKRPGKKVKESPKKEEVNTSDEELLEATRALEKDQEDKKKQDEEEASSVTCNNVTADKPPNLTCNESDEELKMATIELEHLQLPKNDQEGALLVAHQQGGGHQDAQHHEEGDQEAGQVPDQKPSLRMTQIHPDGAQGWKGEHLCQATHGPGGHPVEGEGRHHVQDEGDHHEEAKGV